jgi:hypothetical protein
MEADAAKIKGAMLGNWESIAPEIRPSRNPDGSLKPFYLKRAFKYLPSDRFELDVVNSADPYGAVPLARIKIGGHMLWQGSHPIAPGAQKVDFIADELRSHSLVQGFADVLNKVAWAGYVPWAVNSPQSIFGKTFAPFALKEGTNFMSTTSSTSGAIFCSGAPAPADGPEVTLGLRIVDPLRRIFHG